VNKAAPGDDPRSLPVQRGPTAAGKALWATTAGWLDVHPIGPSDPCRLACTCQDSCLTADCRGQCGCEACTLAWMVRQDERALWNEAGELVPPETLDGHWRRLRDPAQLTLRFHYHSAEQRHG
jgi:hypothetical protein